MKAPPPELIDEFADMRAKMRAWKPDVNPHAQRFGAVKQQILDCYEGADPEQTYLAEGIVYKLPISACELRRKIKDLYKVFLRLKSKRFVSLCSFTLGALEKAIPKDKLAQYIHEERTGPREIGEPVAKEAKVP